MRQTALISVIAVLCVGAASLAEEPGAKELAPRLHLVTGLGEAGNVAFLTSPESVLVVDSGESEQHGKQILQVVLGRSPQPVRYLVFTHLHADHTLGAPAFPASTLVVGQRGLAAAMEKDLAWQLEAYPPHIEKVRAEVERKRAAGDPTLAKEEARLARNVAAFEEVKKVRLRLPDVGVEGTLELRLGGQTVEVRSAAPSHTGDSSVVRFPAQRAAHFGDLLFAGSHPYIDARAGANTAHWIEVLEEAKSWDLAVVIPGHGPVGGKELLDAQIGYLTALRREVAAAIAAGVTLEQATDRVGSAMRAAYPGYGFEAVLPDGIAAVWAELARPAQPSQGSSASGTALFEAIRAGDLQRIARLSSSNPTLLGAHDQNGEPPLHAAILAGRPEVVQHLLELGAPVNEIDGNGYAPLALVAVTSGSMELIRPLVARGADLAATDRWGSSLLDLAETYRRHELTRYLLARILDSTIPSPGPRRDGVTLLHRAARCGSTDGISALLAAGLPVDGTTTPGWTPLHFAAEQGHVEAVTLLLDKHASIDARTVDGSTAHNLATDRGNAEAARILAARRADTRKRAFPTLTGAYFGQEPPGRVATPLAVGIVASGYRLHGTVAFSGDGREAYWAVSDFGPERARAILESRVENGQWTPPHLAAFSRAGLWDDVPFLSPDGKRLFFVSARPLNAGGKPDKERIWVMERDAAGWKAPQPLLPTINGLEGIHHQVSSDAEGNLYFAASPAGGFGEVDVYCARYKDAAFETPVNLGPAINGPNGDATPFIAPDGSYLLFTRYLASGWSLFASFRQTDGRWSLPIDLGSVIEFPGQGSIECPIVTPDGKYLFFTANVNNTALPYWVDASFIETLKKEQLSNLD